MAIQPVPPLVLASEFPTNADRTAGVWNAKATAWAGSENAMATSVRDIAVVTQNNATEAATASAAAVPAAAQAVAARDQAVPAAAQAVAARDQAVPAAAQALDAAQRAEDAAASIEDGPVTSVNGKTGVVNLGIADVVAPGDIVAYGATEAAAREKIKAGFDYTRGQQTWTTSQTINKTLFGSATYLLLEGWGGGQSGQSVVSTGNGGQGGDGAEYAWILLRIADLPASIDIVIGAGGVGGASTSGTPSAQLAGGSTSFGSLLSIPGGGGNANYIGRNGGRGRNLASSVDYNAALGGGGGGSAYGGTPADTGGSSVRGGKGGNGVIAASGTATGQAGSVPGGGGGGSRVNNSTGTATAGSGARGELRGYWW